MNITVTKKELLIAAAAVVLFALLITLASVLYLGNSIKKSVQPAVSAASAANESDGEIGIGFIDDLNESRYTLLEYKGKIGIFDSATKELISVLDVRTITLPALDRELLSTGIDAKSFAELMERVEDYTG